MVVGGEVAPTHLASAHELRICRGAIPLAMTAAHMYTNDAAQKKARQLAWLVKIFMP